MADDVTQLLAAITEMADAQKAGILAETEQEIARIGEHADAEIEQFRAKMLAQLEEQLRIEAECIVGRAQLEIRDRLIQEKNEALDKVFELAAQRIAVINDPATRSEILKRLIREAIGKIDSEEVRLRISGADLSLWESVKGQLPASISVQLCDGPKGTVVVETSDGSQSLDNSIESRLEMARQVVKRELAELLFGGKPPGSQSK